MRAATVAAVLAVLVLGACAPRVVTPENAAVSALSSPPTPTATASPTAAAQAPTAPPTAASSAPSSAPIATPRCAGKAADDVMAFCPEGARVDIDMLVGGRDAAAILAQVSDDLAAVQAEFAWTLRGTPRIDVYATRDRYVAGLTGVFGYSRATAEYLADNSVAFFDPTLTRIAVSWDAVGDRRPIAAIRHELTHIVTLEACARRCDLVPAWLNEGQARLAETTVDGAPWRLMRVRYEAASMVATGTLIPLTSLWTQAQWNSLGDWQGYYKYQEAARATELLKLDVGDHAIARLYARLRAGQDLPTAYAALSGRTFASYLSSLSGRVTAEIAPGPSIVLVTPGPDGSGASYLLYGFPAEASVTVRVRSRLFDQTTQQSVSPQGALFGAIDASYPPGTYTITAASGSAVAAVTVIKRGGRAVRPLKDD